MRPRFRVAGQLERAGRGSSWFLRRGFARYDGWRGRESTGDALWGRRPRQSENSPFVKKPLTSRRKPGPMADRGRRAGYRPNTLSGVRSTAYGPAYRSRFAVTLPCQPFRAEGLTGRDQYGGSMTSSRAGVVPDRDLVGRITSAPRGHKLRATIGVIRRHHDRSVHRVSDRPRSMAT